MRVVDRSCSEPPILSCSLTYVEYAEPFTILKNNIIQFQWRMITFLYQNDLLKYAPHKERLDLRQSIADKEIQELLRKFVTNDPLTIPRLLKPIPINQACLELSWDWSSVFWSSSQWMTFHQRYANLGCCLVGIMWHVVNVGSMMPPLQHVGVAIFSTKFSNLR